MGGNAFEDTVRMTAAEHKRVKQRVLDALLHDDAIAPMLTVVASAEVLDKASFGDVDLYAAPRGDNSSVDPDDVRRRMTDVVVQALRCPVPPKRNGATLSFLTVERYQVDVAFTDPAKLALYAAVHSNGDFALLLQISLSAVGLRLTTEGLFLRDPHRVWQQQSVYSRWDASFLLSLDPVRVAEFLGLPSEAFDGQTSLSMEDQVFGLVVSNRFFDGAAMTAWVCNEIGEEGTAAGKRRKSSSRRARQRPMLRAWGEWWRAVGMARYGDRKPASQCGSYEGVCEMAGEFFEKRAEFREWEAKLREKVANAERVKEFKSLLNFELAKEWFPDLSSMQIGEVLRTLRAEHGQSGSVELLSWVRGMSPEDLRSEAVAVARQLEYLQ